MYVKIKLFSCVFVCLLISNSQGKEIDVKTAISIIQKNESEIRSLEWDCNVKREIVGKEPQLLGKAVVYYDYSGKFRVNKTEIVQWFGGDFQFEYQRSLLTYDGKVFRYEKVKKPVNHNIISSLEDEKIIAEGTISKGYDSSDGSINWNGHPEGLGYVFPHVGAWSDVDFGKSYPLPRLSQMLQEIVKQKKEIQVIENDEGLWNIIYHVIKIDAVDVYCRIEYDPGKGRSGTINKIFRTSKQYLNNPDLEPMISYSYQQFEDFYVPSKIQILYESDKAGKALAFETYTFNEFKVNKVFLDSDFQIDWQKGTNVRDNLTKKFYVVTGDPIDEAEAVRAFRELHGLNRNSLFENNRQFVIFRIIFVILGLSLIAYALYGHFKKKSVS